MLVWCLLTTSFPSLAFFVAYRPPKSNVSKFVGYLSILIYEFLFKGMEHVFIIAFWSFKNDHIQ